MNSKIATPLNAYIEDGNSAPITKNEYPFWISEYGTTYTDLKHQEIRYSSNTVF